MLLLGAFALGGCATYSERLASIRLEADRGEYEAAAASVSALLGVDTVDELPDNWKGSRPVAALERGVLLQASEEFAASARDLSGAETELELLDLKTDTAGQIGKYVYSDAAQDYEASPTERLALNAINMLNYLALGDLSGAAVEGRRFTNMRDYLDSIDLPATGTFGAYLAGFTFEHSGEGDRALRYYEEALEGGSLESLMAPVARLARVNPYRGPRLRELLARATSAEAARAERPAELLVVFALGRVPFRVPERIPIGAAVGIAADWITGNPKILERSLLKVVAYPELVESGTRAGNPSLRVDGDPVSVELVSDLSADIRREYARIKPRILGAAITRMIARALVAEGTRASVREAADASPIVGLLAALAAEGSLVVLDQPDTRSWTFLPAAIAIARVPVEAGRHQVEIEIGGVGESRSLSIDVPDRGFSTVVVTVPR